MKTPSAKGKISGLTLIEVLVVIAIIAILAAMILPMLNGEGRSNQVGCMNNLKQIDLGFSIYASDYGGKYPIQVPVQNGGTMEFIYTDHVFPHFEKLRKYLHEPELFKDLVCPADRVRKAATNAAALNDLNISYFLNADVSYTNHPTQAILAGDRNLMSGGQAVRPGLLVVTTNIDLSWTHELHLRGGNLAFGDGHVEWCKTNALNSAIQRQGLATNRIVVP